jgi:hypothetical protein
VNMPQRKFAVRRRAAYNLMTVKRSTQTTRA